MLSPAPAMSVNGETASKIVLGSPSVQDAVAPLPSASEDDGRGTRQARLIVPAGTQASTAASTLSTLTLHANEYTTGGLGMARMAGSLPPSSAYTYAVEITADEAGNATINFSGPVYSYLDNFLDFPTSTIIPSGYYDPEAAAW